jgi:broad specificity phosphatase PhoE
MAKIIIARHGLSEDNVKGVISGGGSDCGLVQKGESQAHNLGKILLTEYPNKFSFMVTSSMLRTNQTADIVNQHLQIEKVVYDSNLREKEYGEFEGKGSYEKLSLYNFTPYETTPGGESDKTFISRIIPTICEYLVSPVELIFIVSHGYVIKMITEYFFDQPKYIKNCEFVTIDPKDIIDFSGKCGITPQDSQYISVDEL